jgi:tripartite-type tricarboxylate transporter receptor subunit TctC
MPSTRLLNGLLLGLLISALAPAAAQTRPTLTLVVPAGAGSAPDLIARMVGEELRKRLDQPVVIDARPGAGGIIGTMVVKTARPDGNTLLFAQAAVVTVTPLTYRAAVYDMERDFETIAAVAETPMLLVANMQSGPKSLAELIERSRAKPESVTVGTPARGSIPHLTAELLALRAGVRFNTVPFSASPQSLQALLAGDVQVGVDGVGPYQAQVRAGRLLALGISSDRPLPGFEQIPLLKDSVPDLVTSGWFMLFAPKGTPAARIRELNAAVDAVVRDPAVVQRMAATATFPIGGSVADARRFLARESRLWAAAAERAGLVRE